MPVPPSTEEERESLWRRARQLGPLESRAVRGVLALVLALAALAIIPYRLEVTAECVILPAQRRHVRAAMEGVLSEIDVDEGAVVREGQVLARLDDRQLSAERREAEAQVERIRANLLRLRNGVRPEELARQRAVVAAKESSAAFARSELQRQQGLLSNGFVSQQSVDEAQRNVRVAESELAEARALLAQLLAGTRPEELAAEEAELRRAQAELAFVEQRLAEMVTLRAPIAGVVVTPKFKERLHERVAAGDLVCELASTGAMRAEIFVPERELDALRPGLPVTVKVASHPTVAFEGKVLFMGATVEQHNGLECVRVVTELEDPHQLLKQNMTGYGEIHADRQSILSLMSRRLVRWIRVRFLI